MSFIPSTFTYVSDQKSLKRGAALGWQPTFDDIGRALIDTTFVVVDLETTGGSHSNSSITEIGAVKIRGGEIIGEFQTLVNPESPIPAFITVLTGITDAMVIEAPKIGEALFSFLEFAGSPEETVLIAHNAPFDIGFLKAAALECATPWPKFQVIDTARVARCVVTRDEAPNCKLATLANFFGAATNPDHRALSDARATVDVFHGILDRLGSFGVTTLEDLKSFSNRITDSQRKKRYLAEGLPNSPGVYIFRDEQREPLYIGTTRNLKNRVRSYFTAAETRKRIHDMITLAHYLDYIETPTIIEAEVRELRLIAEKQPRFNRRSKFQEKAVWVKITEENFPRLVSVRGQRGLSDDLGWCGPFNGRDEAARAIEAIYEVTQIRQCSPRITLNSMKSASPCALFDMKKCGAPCVGKESVDSYSSHVLTTQISMHHDATTILNSINQRMKELAHQERFEEAAELRNRLSSFIRGTARGQRIRSLTRVPHLIAALPVSPRQWEFIVIRYGRLAGSAQGSSANYRDVIESLILTADVVVDNGEILPASHHEEVEVLLRYLSHDGIRLIDIQGEWCMPTFGSGAARENLERVREVSDSLRYKEDFANSFERSAQRSTR
ncbi:MAG: DEDD exonuclease domain-containing protein [Candidatus Nanopelagicaceae bacterium]|nr:DEDD exonuclease domain-containing protein [Candidatus Nanopelagicaceae bacterium]